MVFICIPDPVIVSVFLGPLSMMPWFESVTVNSPFALLALFSEPGGPAGPFALVLRVLRLSPERPGCLGSLGSPVVR